MLVQGLTPVLRMPFENIGRRPVLVGTLFFFSGASIGLVYNRGFTMLLVFRAIQGGGSAALTAIGKLESPNGAEQLLIAL
jgi:MFS family permease